MDEQQFQSLLKSYNPQAPITVVGNISHFDGNISDPPTNVDDSNRGTMIEKKPDEQREKLIENYKTRLDQILKVNFIQRLLLTFELWSLLMIPGLGYALGKFIQFILKTNIYPVCGILAAHLVTMIFMISTINELIYHSETKTSQDKILLVCMSYILVLSCVVGIAT